MKKDQTSPHGNIYKKLGKVIFEAKRLGYNEKRV